MTRRTSVRRVFAFTNATHRAAALQALPILDGLSIGSHESFQGCIGPFQGSIVSATRNGADCVMADTKLMDAISISGRGFG